MADQQIYFRIQSALAGVDYPASRDDLVSTAQRQGADDDVLAALRGLPDREFAGPTEISDAVAS